MVDFKFQLTHLSDLFPFWECPRARGKLEFKIQSNLKSLAF